MRFPASLSALLNLSQTCSVPLAFRASFFDAFPIGDRNGLFLQKWMLQQLLRRLSLFRIPSQHAPNKIGRNAHIPNLKPTRLLLDRDIRHGEAISSLLRPRIIEVQLAMRTFDEEVRGRLA